MVVRTHGRSFPFQEASTSRSAHRPALYKRGEEEPSPSPSPRFIICETPGLHVRIRTTVRERHPMGSHCGNRPDLVALRLSQRRASFYLGEPVPLYRTRAPAFLLHPRGVSRGEEPHLHSHSHSGSGDESPLHFGMGAGVASIGSTSSGKLPDSWGGASASMGGQKVEED